MWRVTVVKPVYHWRPDEAAGEDVLSPASGHHHLQAQEASIILTIDTDLFLVNRIKGRDGSEGLL